MWPSILFPVLPLRFSSWGGGVGPIMGRQPKLGTRGHGYLILSLFKLFSSMFVFHPISPLGSEFLEGKDSVSAFFPTRLQLPVSVLSAQ